MARIPRGEQRKHPGKISMSRRSGPDGDTISLTIEDTASGIQIIDLEMAVETLGYVITGLGAQRCSFELRGADLVGKHAEYKDERVPVYVADYEDRYRVAAEAAKQFEKDGWIYAGPRDRNSSWSQGDWKSYDNPMGQGPNLSNEIVRLRFIRYVEPAAEQPQTRTRIRVRKPEQE